MKKLYAKRSTAHARISTTSDDASEPTDTDGRQKPSTLCCRRGASPWLALPRDVPVLRRAGLAPKRATRADDIRGRWRTNDIAVAWLAVNARADPTVNDAHCDMSLGRASLSVRLQSQRRCGSPHRQGASGRGNDPPVSVARFASVLVRVRAVLVPWWLQRLNHDGLADSEGLCALGTPASDQPVVFRQGSRRRGHEHESYPTLGPWHGGTARVTVCDRPGQNRPSHFTRKGDRVAMGLRPCT